tara:strand:+ start:26128 stop:27486 length:1359 start_codon:yes stop_codon:yes gene_type:complete
MQHTPEYHTLIKLIIDNHPLEQLQHQIDSLIPAEISDLLEAIPYKKRLHIWEKLDYPIKGEVLTELHEDVQKQIIHETDNADLVEAVRQLQPDEIADLRQSLPEGVEQLIISKMDHETRQQYKVVKGYADNTAGGLMDLDAISVRSETTIDATLRYFRRLRAQRERFPEHMDAIFIVDRENHYLGKVSLKDLVSKVPETLMADIMNTQLIPIKDKESELKVAQKFENEDLISAPVVNESNQLIGRITIDDIVDVIRQQGERLAMSPAGLSETTDVFSPILRTVRHRSFWLGINLIIAFFAAWVIGFYTDIIEQKVALAVLMPVVASMGGVVGNQTLTLVTRGIALDQITSSNKYHLLFKEIRVGLLNGIIWASVVGFIVYAWHHDIHLSLAFSIAMLLSVVLTATAGTLIPLILNKLNIDPAVAGSVLMVAVSDVAGFFIFLSTASIIMLSW